MAPVKMPKAVLRIFNQYDEKKIKELEQTEAIYMLRAEFLLTPEQALGVFNSFDIDKNGKMSLSEFYQFYKFLGEHIEAIVTKFKTMDKDGNGTIDREEAGLGLKGLKTGKGKIIQDQDIDFLMKAFAGESNVINLGDFSKLLQKLKVYDGSELAD